VSEWKTSAPAATGQRYRGTYEQILETPDESAQHGVKPGGFWCAVAADRHGDVERVAVFFFVPEHQAEIRSALIGVLDARARAIPEDAPMLTFAADRLARKLWVDRPPAASLHRELAPLLRRGLRFVDDPYDQLSRYDGAFMRVLLRRWPEAQWGQFA